PREAERGHGGLVDAGGLVGDRRGGYGERQAAHDEPGPAQHVAADVQEGAAAHLGPDADVVPVAPERVVEPGVGVQHVADLAVFDDLPQAAALAVKAVDKGFHQHDAGVFAGLDGLFRLLVGHREGLFAKDVLAGVGRFDNPLRVQRVGQRDVDCVDLGIVQYGVVGVVSDRDAVRLGVLLGLFATAAPHR